jgi:hypothetical protein
VKEKDSDKHSSLLRHEINDSRQNLYGENKSKLVKKRIKIAKNFFLLK